MKTRIGRTRSSAWLALVMLVICGGCAESVQPPAVPVFFPAAPELPRVQFLTSFSGRKDLEHQSAFDKFVLGENQDLKIDKPYGVAIADGKIYVCDSNTTVLVLDVKGQKFQPLQGAVGPGALRQPINVSIGADGTRYVSDPVRGQVVAFDREDRYLRAYGTPGAWKPVDAVPFENRLYVVDTQSKLVKVLDRESGEPVKTIGDKGAPTERLDRPTNLTIDREGYLYVTDFGRFQVVKFDRDGHYQMVFGGPGDNFGKFARPKGVAVDRDGRLYVVDASFNNVQVFSPQGRLLMYLGGAPADQGGSLLLPAKVAIDYDGVGDFQKYLAPGFHADYLLLVTSQFGERRVNVLAYGHEEGKTYPSDADLLKQLDERKAKELAAPQ